MAEPHHCFVDDDRKAIVCLCIRGVDHTEDEFDVPVDE